MAEARSYALGEHQYWDAQTVTTNDKGANLQNLFWRSGQKYYAGDIVIHPELNSSDSKYHYKLYVCINTSSQGSMVEPSTSSADWTIVFVNI